MKIGSNKIKPIWREFTNTAGNRFQTCSDIFCRKYISMKIGSKKSTQHGRKKYISRGVPTKFSNFSKSITKQSWQTKKIIELKVPGHGLNGSILEREHQ